MGIRLPHTVPARARFEEWLAEASRYQFLSALTYGLAALAFASCLLFIAACGGGSEPVATTAQALPEDSVGWWRVAVSALAGGGVGATLTKLVDSVLRHRGQHEQIQRTAHEHLVESLQARVTQLVQQKDDLQGRKEARETELWAKVEQVTADLFTARGKLEAAEQKCALQEEHLRRVEEDNARLREREDVLRRSLDRSSFDNMELVEKNLALIGRHLPRPGDLESFNGEVR